MSEYSVYKADSQAWDRFASQSTTSSIFASSPFLDATGSNWAAWIVDDDSGPVVGATIQDPSDTGGAFNLYNGILLTAKVAGSVAALKNAFGCLLNTISDSSAGKSIQMSLHGDITDVRPFNWWAEETSSIVKIVPKYSAVISGIMESKYNDYSTALGYRRRRDFRRAISAQLSVINSDNVAELIQLHEQTLRRHGAVQSNSDIKLISNLSRELLSRRMGELLISVSTSGDTLSSILWTHDQYSAYVIFWANHDDALACGSSTYLVMELIRRCRNLGLNRLDLGGMNSYGRSEYKESLSANPMQYFEVCISIAS